LGPGVEAGKGLSKSQGPLQRGEKISKKGGGGNLLDEEEQRSVHSKMWKRSTEKPRTDIIRGCSIPAE